MKDILLNYVQYNLWANKKIGDVVLGLSPAQFDQEIKSSFPSVRKTWCHIWGAEEIWHRRLQSESNIKVTVWNFEGAHTDAVSGLLSQSEKFIKLIAAAEDEWLNKQNTHQDIRGNTHTQAHWQMIMHCMNHSTFHRGQLITMFRQLGVQTIPQTDLIAYFRELK